MDWIACNVGNVPKAKDNCDRDKDKIACHKDNFQTNNVTSCLNSKRNVVSFGCFLTLTVAGAMY